MNELITTKIINGKEFTVRHLDEVSYYRAIGDIATADTIQPALAYREPDMIRAHGGERHSRGAGLHAAMESNLSGAGDYCGDSTE